MNDAPANDAPADDAPADDAPANDAPANDAPANDAPANVAPAIMQFSAATPFHSHQPLPYLLKPLIVTKLPIETNTPIVT